MAPDARDGVGAFMLAERLQLAEPGAHEGALVWRKGNRLADGRISGFMHMQAEVRTICLSKHEGIRLKVRASASECGDGPEESGRAEQSLTRMEARARAS